VRNNILKVPKFPVCANFFTAKNKKPTFLQGSNFKIAQIVLKPLPMYSSGHKDSEKIYFDISRMYRSWVINKKAKGQKLGFTGAKNAKMLRFCWKWSQNYHLATLIEIKNGLHYVGYFVTLVTIKNGQRLLNTIDPDLFLVLPR